MIRRKASVVTQKPAGTRMPSIRESSPSCAPLPPASATCVLSISSRPSTYRSIIAALILFPASSIPGPACHYAAGSGFRRAGAVETAGSGGGDRVVGDAGRAAGGEAAFLRLDRVAGVFGRLDARLEHPEAAEGRGRHQRQPG